MNGSNERADDWEDRIVAPANDGRRVKLHFLKTPLETRTRNPLVDVFITVIPIKQANSALDYIRRIIPDDGGLDLQHLRRFAKYEDLPESVRTAISVSRNHSTSDSSNEDLSKVRILIVAPINAISQQTLIESLSSILTPVSICSISVPLLAPTSQEQATMLTSEFWPTVYKKMNPFGPHFTMVARAEDDIREDVERWMDLAEQVACEASITKSGEHIGVVVVERKDGVARPVAIAGDARWHDWPRTSSGNVTAHATLRAISMVAQGLKLHDEAEQGNGDTTESEGPIIFRDQPFGQLEQDHCHPSTSGDGYLCHDLEIYCTHEPCVMCSMAIVHSRFGKIIFKQRMPRTGGISADNELGHGLFWRKELNWTLLAWQWSADDDDTKNLAAANMHA